MKKLTIHLISEFSGQTIKYLVNSVISRFSGIEIRKYYWPMVKNSQLLENILSTISKKDTIVMHSIFSNKVKKILHDYCDKHDIPCISTIDHVINTISSFVGKRMDYQLSYDVKFSKRYFDKIEAMNFTLKYDDGKGINAMVINEADIVLIGPSRTTKTPTAIYLAYNGFKTVNIPIVHEYELPDILYDIKNTMIVGLTINPKRLTALRESRIKLMKSSLSTDYTDLDYVVKECQLVKRLCEENKWFIIDVSFRSIEETASIIMNLYYTKYSN